MEEDDVLIDEDQMEDELPDDGEVEEEFMVDGVSQSFPKLTPTAAGTKGSIRRIPVPPHRYTPLRNDWVKICSPIVHNLKLQIRMNPKQRTIEIRVIQFTKKIIKSNLLIIHFYFQKKKVFRTYRRYWYITKGC